MSTLQSSIQLRDTMTPVFRNLVGVMTTVVGTFEEMNAASNYAVDITNINQARKSLTQLNGDLENIENQIQQTVQGQQNYTRAVQGSTSAAGGLLSKVGGIAAAVGGMAAIKSAVNLSDEMTQTKARLNLIVDDGGSVDELQQRIFQMAQRSRADYLATGDVVAKLAQRAGDVWASNDETIKFAENLNKQFVIAGASQQEMQSASLQLTQALGSGVLRGEELNAVFESAPNIIQTIADYMDVPIGQIRDMASEGQISAEIVKNAMLGATDAIDAQFNQMPMTWAQVWTSFQNRAIMAFEPILAKINELANNEDIQLFINNMVIALQTMAMYVMEAFEWIASFGSTIASNWSIISPFVYAVVAALVLYNAVKFISNTVTAVHNGLMAVSAAQTALATGATFAQTAAQHGLNAALMACPLTWIILLIIAIIAIIYAVVAAINKVTGSTISATGIITGALAVAAAFIGNLFVAVINFVIDIFVVLWNFIAAFANFFANVFTDPVGAIARLFFDLVDVVLSLLQSLASAIDTIFGSNLAGSVQGWRDDLGAWVDDTFGKGAEIMAQLNAEDMHLGRFEYGDAWDAGYNWGAGLEADIGNFFNGDEHKGLANSNPGDYALEYDYQPYDDLGGVNANTGDTADNTARIADSMDSSADELKWIREIAERQAINQFTTAQVTVDMTGMNNQISSDVDIDGFFGMFEERFEESILISQEKVSI